MKIWRDVFIKYTTSHIIGVSYNLLWNFIRIRDVDYNVNTDITITRLKSQFQQCGTLHIGLIERADQRMQYIGETWKLAVVTLLEVQLWFLVEKLRKRTNSQDMSRLLVWNWPCDTKHKTVGVQTCCSIRRLHSKSCARRKYSAACAACTRQEVCHWFWMLHFWHIHLMFCAVGPGSAIRNNKSHQILYTKNITKY